MLGNAYEYLLKQFADESGKKAGEFFTPRSVVRLLTRILDPQPTDTVYDPACGSGGMLVEAANEVIEAGGSLRQMRFYGQEVNLTTAAIARMNLFLHDIEDVVIRRGDTLRDPKFLDERGRLQRFDVVITNPPFSLKNWGADVWSHDPWGRRVCGVPPAGNGDFAWVQHMLASMTAGDRPRRRRHAPRRAVPGRRRGRDPRVPPRSDRLDAVVGLAAEPLLLDRHPGCFCLPAATKAGAPGARPASSTAPSGSSRAATRTACDPRCRGARRRLPDGDQAHGDGGVEVRLVPSPEVEANGWDLNIGRYVRGARCRGASMSRLRSRTRRGADSHARCRGSPGRAALARRAMPEGWVGPPHLPAMSRRSIRAQPPTRHLTAPFVPMDAVEPGAQWPR